MGRTIIQPIGPLYGEAVNGTVFGRPNGSVFVPSTNTISITKKTTTVYVRIAGNKTNIYTCNNSGSPQLQYLNIVAEAQDLASYIVTEIGTDGEFSTSTSRQFSSGQFNLTEGRIAIGNYPDDFSITDGTTYYLRAILMASTNVPVAYSDTMEIVGYDDS